MGTVSLLLQNITVPEDLNKSVSLIMASSVPLVTVVNNMLGVRKCEANMMTEFKLDTIDPTPPVQDDVNFCQPLAKISKEALNTCLEPNVFVWSDLLRVQEVLINVISNAIKHTHSAGRIIIPSALSSKARVKKLLDEALVVGNNPENRTLVPDGRILVISVADSGAGIPESTNEVIPDVFSI